MLDVGSCGPAVPSGRTVESSPWRSNSTSPSRRYRSSRQLGGDRGVECSMSGVLTSAKPWSSAWRRKACSRRCQRTASVGRMSFIPLTARSSMTGAAYARSARAGQAVRIGLHSRGAAIVGPAYPRRTRSGAAQALFLPSDEQAKGAACGRGRSGHGARRSGSNRRARFVGPLARHPRRQEPAGASHEAFGARRSRRPSRSSS